MKFVEFKETLAKSQVVKAVKKTALKKLLDEGNFQALAVLASASNAIDNFASAGSQLLQEFKTLPKSVLADIEAAFGEQSATTPVAKKRGRPRKTSSAKAATKKSATKRKTVANGHSGEIEKMLKDGLTTKEIFDKLGRYGVTVGSIRAIKAHKTRKANGHAKPGPKPKKTVAKKTTAKKPAVAKKKSVVVKKKRGMSAGRKQALHEAIRKILDTDIVETDEIKKELVKAGFKNVNGRTIHGIRVTHKGGGFSKKK